MTYTHDDDAIKIKKPAFFREFGSVAGLFPPGVPFTAKHFI
jgi:hypothetical protein